MKTLLSLVLLTACGTLPTRDSEIRSVSSAQANSVAIVSECSLFGDSPNVHIHMGTGTLVDGRHVLTAMHVTTCPDFPVVTVELFNGKQYPFIVTQESGSYDQAMLEIGTADVLDVAPVRYEFPMTGAMECYYPMAPARDIKCGTLEHDNMRPNRMLLTQDVLPGNSGAGVYHNGYLVGVVTDRFVDAPGGIASFINPDWTH